MNPRWIKACERLASFMDAHKELYPDKPIATTHSPRRDLSGAQVEVHRAMNVSSSGCWILWCERGPLILKKRDGESKWIAIPDFTFARELGCDDLFSEFSVWCATRPALTAGFSTMRELISVIRETLMRSPI